MFIRVEKSSGVPISRQIADQVRALCLAGRLEAGQRIPSVRQLARELGVNQNTILRVYERLTADGLLDRRHGEGTFVAADPPAGLLAEQRRELADELRQIVRRGRLLGLDAGAWRRLLDEALAETVPAAGADEKEVRS